MNIDCRVIFSKLTQIEIDRLMIDILGFLAPLIVFVAGFVGLLGPRRVGIRANCVCPGPVRTKLAMAVHTPEIIAAYHDAIPLNRYGSEREIAEVITFLCSDKASYVTGQVIASDGGFESTGVGLPALRE